MYENVRQMYANIKNFKNVQKYSKMYEQKLYDNVRKCTKIFEIEQKCTKNE